MGGQMVVGSPEQKQKLAALGIRDGGKKSSGPPPDYQGAVKQMGAPINWGADFGKMQDGQAAADQAYGQATSRLDPQWANREESTRTRLLNQGLDPNSEAYQNEMAQLEHARNDAYGQARTQAFGMGRGLFQDNLMARQQAIVEALKRRSQPLSELGALQGLYRENGEIEADNNPLNGVADFVGGILNLIP